MVGVARKDIIITCRKDLWHDKNGDLSRFAKDTRLAKANWVHKSTKGTNDYRNCTQAIHMFDINLNPSIAKFLDVSMFFMFFPSNTMWLAKQKFVQM